MLMIEEEGWHIIFHPIYVGNICAQLMHKYLKKEGVCIIEIIEKYVLSYIDACIK